MDEFLAEVSRHPGEAAVTVSLSTLAVVALAFVAIQWLRSRSPPG